jgi:hypothetical protein
MTISELGGFQRKEGRKLWTSFRNSCWFQKWEDLKGRNEGRKEVVDFIHLQMYSFSIDFMYYITLFTNPITSLSPIFAHWSTHHCQLQRS